MGKRVQILVVCGCGVGSSVMLRGNLLSVLSKHGLRVDIDIADMLSAPSFSADVLIGASDVLEHMKSLKNFRKVVTISNFMSTKELEDKIVPLIKEFNNDNLKLKGDN